MQQVVIVIHLMLVLALIGAVLLQRSEGGGLGIGGGGGFMTSRGTANVLTRATAILAGLFFVTSLVLSILAGFNRKPTTILDGSPGAPAQTVPGAPSVPTPNAPGPGGGGGGGLLNKLQQGAPGGPRGAQRAGGAAVKVRVQEGPGETGPSAFCRSALIGWPCLC